MSSPSDTWRPVWQTEYPAQLSHVKSVNLREFSSRRCPTQFLFHFKSTKVVLLFLIIQHEKPVPWFSAKQSEVSSVWRQNNGPPLQLLTSRSAVPRQHQRSSPADTRRTGRGGCDLISSAERKEKKRKSNKERGTKKKESKETDKQYLIRPSPSLLSPTGHSLQASR